MNGSMGWPRGAREEVEDPAHLTTGDSTVRYDLQYEFDSASDLTDGLTYTNGSGVFGIDVGDGRLCMSGTGGSYDQLQGVSWPHSLADGQVVETALSGWLATDTGYGFAFLSLGVDLDSSGDAVNVVGYAFNQDHAGVLYVGHGTLANPTTTSISSSIDPKTNGAIRFRIKRISSTSYQAQAGLGGGVWMDLGSTYDPSMTPNRVGLFVNNSTPHVAAFDYIRVYTP